MHTQPGLHDERGFSLVELTVVLLIMSVLMVIGMVAYARLAHIADDEAVQLELVSAAKVELLYHLENAVFSSDPGALRVLEPSLRYSADGADQSIVVALEPAYAESHVCLFAQSKRGGWFSLHSSIGGGIRYGRSAPLACTPLNVVGWSSAPW